MGTYSLRRAGAKLHRTACCVPEELVQAQGGWSAPKTIRTFLRPFLRLGTARSAATRRVYSF
eukprot:397288-Pyramimonas_sp.AAC.1